MSALMDFHSERRAASRDSASGRVGDPFRSWFRCEEGQRTGLAVASGKEASKACHLDACPCNTANPVTSQSTAPRVSVRAVPESSFGMTS